MNDVFDAWEKARFHELKPTTQAEYGRLLEIFASYVGTTPSADFTRQDFQDLVDIFPAGSRRGAFSTLAACIRWSARNDWPGLDATIPGRPPARRHREDCFSETDYHHWWRALEMARQPRLLAKKRWCTQQTRDALEVLTRTGMRVGELVSLKWDECDLVYRRIVLRDTKVGDRAIPISSLTRSVLDRQPRRGASVWLRPDGSRLQAKGVSHAFKRICRRYGRPLDRDSLCLHTLRHSVATALAARGCQDYAQVLLGHSSQWMTQRYVHLNDSGLRREIESLERSWLGAGSVQLRLGVE